jgi:hypothetical protein
MLKHLKVINKYKNEIPSNLLLDNDLVAVV